MTGLEYHPQAIDYNWLLVSSSGCLSYPGTALAFFIPTRSTDLSNLAWASSGDPPLVFSKSFALAVAALSFSISSSLALSTTALSYAFLLTAFANLDVFPHLSQAFLSAHSPPAVANPTAQVSTVAASVTSNFSFFFLEPLFLHRAQCLFMAPFFPYFSWFFMNFCKKYFFTRARKIFLLMT